MSLDRTLHGDRRRAGSFGEVAEQYDRVRPEYPAELVDALLAGRPRTVLDVGCGTGISSRLFIARGCAVVGLEPDPRMAQVARRRGVPVESGTIEEWDAGARRFDLLTAGQSWHWVEPQRGAAKAAAVLRPGGRIGLFWNQAKPDRSVRPALDAAYARHAPELSRQSVLLGRRDPSLYQSCADTLRATGAFADVSIGVFGHEVDYSIGEWIDLAVTHSDHRTLPPGQLAGLLADLQKELERAGGRVPVHYEATLVTGVRR
ncbi:MAG: class I SAM-dependent methyltransferase [Acidimicrobiales bacterium]